MDRVDMLSAGEPLANSEPRNEMAEVAAVETAGFMFRDSFVLAPPANSNEPVRTSERNGQFSGRLLDVVVASLLLLLTLPLMGVCALAVALSGPGPLLFRQKRVGRFGREFTCLKFRTMVPNAEVVIERILESSIDAEANWNAAQKLRSDPRVTGVGRFLRRYCLDELPQLFNVLAGDMSIVGPRPIVAGEVGRYGANFADYCAVKPGLTGLWQVSGGHAVSYDERVRLDTAYVRSKSVRSDLAILWRTVPVVLMGQNF